MTRLYYLRRRAAAAIAASPRDQAALGVLCLLRTAEADRVAHALGASLADATLRLHRLSTVGLARYDAGQERWAATDDGHNLSLASRWAALKGANDAHHRERVQRLDPEELDAAAALDGLEVSA